jgi:aminoglycoside 6'-N-acetyltransferase
MSDAAASIRHATPADDPALARLEHESAIHHATLDPERWLVPPLEEIGAFMRRRQDEGSEVLVAERDGEVVGMVEFAVREPGHPGGARVRERLLDLGITVAEGSRGQGIGEALMGAAEDWARAHGISRVVLDMAAANAGARRFYDRLGYVEHGQMLDKVLTGVTPAPAPARVAEEPPTLRGDLVTLRPLRADDREALHEVLRDPSVVAVWDTRGPEVSTEELLAGEPDWHVFAIEIDGEFAGSIQASEENDDPDYRHAGIDVFLSSRFQGRGAGTDAVRTVARWLIEERGHHRLTIDPAADNARAIRTYEKVGFKPVGVMRQYERGVDGTFHDSLLMDLLAGELTSSTT